jgi:hypothetical protein
MIHAPWASMRRRVDNLNFGVTLFLWQRHHRLKKISGRQCVMHCVFRIVLCRNRCLPRPVVAISKAKALPHCKKSNQTLGANLRPNPGEKALAEGLPYNRPGHSSYDARRQGPRLSQCGGALHRWHGWYGRIAESIGRFKVIWINRQNPHDEFQMKFLSSPRFFSPPVRLAYRP